MLRKMEQDLTALTAPETPASPQGFKAFGMAAQIKKSGKPDLGVIVSEADCAVAGVFTTNAFCAAPVAWGRQLIARGRGRAVIVNSGNANCATGVQGDKDCAAMAAVVGKAIGCPAGEVLVSSTGVIGVPMPMAKIRRGVPAVIQSAQALDADAPLELRAGWEAFAEAIRTTDTVRKLAGAAIEVGGREVRILGVAKGSGMIHPNMATMLSYVVTDATIAPEDLQSLFAPAAEATYNSVTVDGDTSTNDTAVILANGAAGAPAIKPRGAVGKQFRAALEAVCQSLARQLVRDGEGASKIGIVRVRGARSAEDARRAARAVATSSLVKTALFGADANWGRIACAVGYSGAQVVPNKTDIAIGPLKLLEKGRPVKFSEARAAKIMSAEEVIIEVNLNLGRHEATYWTSDLTYEYVRINADYRS